MHLQFKIAFPHWLDFFDNQSESCREKLANEEIDLVNQLTDEPHQQFYLPDSMSSWIMTQDCSLYPGY